MLALYGLVDRWDIRKGVCGMKYTMPHSGYQSLSVYGVETCCTEKYVCMKEGRGLEYENVDHITINSDED